MDTPAQDLSYLLNNIFIDADVAGESIVREKVPEYKGTNTQTFSTGIQAFEIFKKNILKKGYGKTWEDMESLFGFPLSKEKRKMWFRYIFERENYDELIDIKEEFQIKLFKTLSIGSKSLRVDENAFEILDIQRQITKDSDGIHSRIIMRPGDLEIVLADSFELSTSVKQFEIPRKSVPRVIVKGKDCFLQTRTPDGFLADDLLTIELATQEDIKNVFELMNKIL